MRTSRLLLALAAGLSSGLAGAAPPEEPPPRPQRGGSFVEPPAQVDPQYLPPAPGQAATAAAAQPVLRLRLTAEVPLRRPGQALGQGAQGPRAASPSAQAQLRWQPVPGAGWFAQLNAFRYLEPGRQRPWDPDFSYAFGWDDGQPGRWALVYANYTGTRLWPQAGQSRFNWLQGQLTLSRRFAPAAPWDQLVLVGDGDAALCSADANLVPRYNRADGGPAGHGKLSLALGCRYTRPGGWFVHATAFAWPDRAQQQPWDPDFTYGAGWAQPGPTGLRVQYANYSGNRWSGRAPGPGEGRPRSGSLSISWETGL